MLSRWIENASRIVAASKSPDVSGLVALIPMTYVLPSSPSVADLSVLRSGIGWDNVRRKGGLERAVSVRLMKDTIPNRFEIEIQLTTKA
jgi:hypothetical protein